MIVRRAKEGRFGAKRITLPAFITRNGSMAALADFLERRAPHRSLWLP